MYENHKDLNRVQQITLPCVIFLFLKNVAKTRLNIIVHNCVTLPITQNRTRKETKIVAGINEQEDPVQLVDCSQTLQSPPLVC